MDNSRITELTSTLLHSEANNNYYIRIIEYPGKDGVPVRKVGISEFWYCEKSKRWFPSRRHHVYMPLSAWSRVVDFTDTVDKFRVADGKGYSHISSSTVAHPPAGDAERVGRRSAKRKRERTGNSGDGDDGDDDDDNDSASGDDRARPTKKSKRTINREAAGKAETSMQGNTLSSGCGTAIAAAVASNGVIDFAADACTMPDVS